VFARRVFLTAGVLGILLVAPLYFLEARMSELFPPPITHPELYYGLVGVALVFQLLYLMIARDPVGLRSVMPIAVLGKLSVAVPSFVLVALGRSPATALGFPVFDAFFAVLFVLAYLKTEAPPLGANSPRA
jgi:hypothetical protein